MKRDTLERAMGWNTPTHCPVCGRGLSSRYRSEPHNRRLKRRIGRWAPPALRRVPCPWVPTPNPLTHLTPRWVQPEVIPTCDICDEQWEEGGEGEDWNGETGNHFSCEKEQADATR